MLRSTRISELHRISNMQTVKERQIKLSCQYVSKSLKFNPLIQLVTKEFLDSRSKFQWFHSSPLSSIIPLIACVKATIIYCSAIGLIISLLALCHLNSSEKRSLTTSKLRSLKHMIYDVCVQGMRDYLTSSMYRHMVGQM